MKKAFVLSIDEDISEIRSLLSTLDIAVVGETVQKRSRPHSVGYLGPGRLEEVEEEIDKGQVDLIVVNGILKPSQHHFLEMMFQMECMDRFGVILRIFSEHAHTPEAAAQVQLARFRYELPFLREWIHKAKSGDRPGFLAGGAYATDAYFEYARKQVNRIEKYLERVSKEREVTRSRRRAKGYMLVCLSGYTNAGKSSLLNQICRSSAEVDSRMFSTLSTTTRKVPGITGNALMTDTVGFIRNLPPDLVDAFKSTLEEIFYADVILLVFDAAEALDQIEMTLSTSMNILVPKIEDRELLVIGNKIDLVREETRNAIREVAAKVAHPYEVMLASATTGEGIDSIRHKVEEAQHKTCVIDADLPLTNEAYSLVSRLHSKATVRARTTGDRLKITLTCRPEDYEMISGWLRAHGASTVHSVAVRE